MSLASGTSGRGLDFFCLCDVACIEVNRLVATSAAEVSFRSLLRLVHRELALLHDMPLQTLNDRLKRYPFVDPQPFDELISEVIRTICDWLAYVTRPYWLAEVIEQSVRLAQRSKTSTSVEDDLELETLARFDYPIPLKLRELQGMVRPFLEVRSSHHIEGVDAMTSELVRGFLTIHRSIKEWDSVLIRHIQALATAGFNVSGFQDRVVALADLCAVAQMPSFEVSHRLNRVDPNVFRFSKSEISEICRRLPQLEEHRLFFGAPTLILEHGAPASQVLCQPGQNDSASQEGIVGAWSSMPGLQEARTEALQWWWQRGFSRAVPSRILAAELLSQLAMYQLHPDPWVTEMLPRVFEHLFGVQVSCDCFMNKFLPKVGGYTDKSGITEILQGCGLKLLSDPTRAAETLLVFLRHWAELVSGAEEEAIRPVHKEDFKIMEVTRCSEFSMATYLEKIQQTGHRLDDVNDLLDGCVEIPKEILEIKADDRRYKVDEESVRRWEILSRVNLDSIEPLANFHRDLGPYLQNIDVLNEAKMASLWEGLYNEEAAHLHNPEVLSKSKQEYTLDDCGEEEANRFQALGLSDQDDVSDFLGLRLVDAPEDLKSENCSSNFMRFLRLDQRALISRRKLEGLPELPWCLGSDARNTVVLDVPSGIDPFHCILSKSRAQGKRVCLQTLGDGSNPSYIVCPKYQPLQVFTGYRFLCHDRTFEIRIKPDFDTRTSRLFILIDDGTRFEAPPEGCHVGVNACSRRRPYQPFFQSAKMVLEKSPGVDEVQLSFNYEAPMDRWTVVDHSAEELGTLLELKPGTAYPLSKGMRFCLGSLQFEMTLDT
eukprot:TRINITY_DN1073_c0_g1_i1.p1 TRINITY_DN1073_c0_g1~~TRINITY_DN1073_c0_g1_i1.p1  ORF type:complete len:827 (+),score=138.66 TRINITY_DN1073_c0_g1_i1:75-2555(+)